MTHKFKTTLIWHDSRGGECEAEVTVSYERHKGFNGNHVEPGEPDSVEISDILPINSGDTFPVRFFEDEELMAECLEHWSDDDAAAEEYRADAARDDRMMDGR